MTGTRSPEIRRLETLDVYLKTQGATRLHRGRKESRRSPARLALLSSASALHCLSGEAQVGYRHPRSASPRNDFTRGEQSLPLARAHPRRKRRRCRPPWLSGSALSPRARRRPPVKPGKRMRQARSRGTWAHEAPGQGCASDDAQQAPATQQAPTRLNSTEQRVAHGRAGACRRAAAGAGRLLKTRRERGVVCHL
jgi:hypothetical protein